MNPYNPMFDYQRNNLLAQQQMIQNQLNQLNRSYNFPQNNNPQFVVKPVGSIEEAKGFPVDPNVMYLFPDSGSGKIYLKKLNTENGKSELFTYSINESEVKPSDPMDFVNSRLDSIEKKIGGIYESISVFTNSGSAGEESSRSSTTAGSSENAGAEPTEV